MTLPEVLVDFTCLDDTSFAILKQDARSFDDANARCGLLNATLARISSLEEFAFVLKLGTEAEDDVRDFFMGAQNKNGTGLASDFVFVDNFPDNSFFAKNGVFPWKNPAQPEERKSCIRFRFTLQDDNSWESVDCIGNNQPICRKDCATFVAVPSENNAGSKNESLQVGLGVLTAVGLLLVLILAVFVFLEEKQVKKLKSRLAIMRSPE